MSNKSDRKHETSPCAGCKIQRKKCSKKCVLAPYFPHNDLEKFRLVHRVFGNGHVVKLLQDLPAEKRGDAVSSMVYEARARVGDPVHGCVRVIKDLQNKLAELQLQLESTQLEIANVSLQHANLLTLITGFEQGSYADFYTPALQEIEDTLMNQEIEDTFMNPTVLDDTVDPLELWETILEPKL